MNLSDRLSHMREVLIQRRLRLGMTRADLAVKLGLKVDNRHNEQIADWERGTDTPLMSNFLRWCEALGMGFDLRPLRAPRLPPVPVIRKPDQAAVEFVTRFAAQLGYDYEAMIGPRRNRMVSTVRHAAMRALAAERPDMSLPDIGAVFRRDHTTVMYALGKTKISPRFRAEERRGLTARGISA